MTLWDWDFVRDFMPSLLAGLRTTVFATLAGSPLALLLGLLLTLSRLRGGRSLRTFAGAYVYVIRGTPLLVQLYFWFYVLPGFGITLSPLVAGQVALGVNFAPYFAEVLRAGIQSVPTGQWDATVALNFSPWRTWRTVILPQAIPPILPALGNYVNSMFKASALLAAISVHELFGTAISTGNGTFRYLEPMTICGLLYLAVSVPVSLLIRRLENRGSTSQKQRVTLRKRLAGV